jgi:hypothetical protein
MWSSILNIWWPILLLGAVWLALSVYGSRRLKKTVAPQLAELEKKPNHLTIARQPSVVDITRAYRVEIDGNIAGQISAGEVQFFPVSPGKHSVVLKVDWCSSPASEVDVQAGAGAMLYCGATYTDWRCTFAPFICANNYLYVRPAPASEVEPLAQPSIQRQATQMSPLNPNEKVVATGTFRYAGTIECDLRIVFSPVRYGSGDDEDESEIANDLVADTYYVQYGSASQRGIFNACGGAYPSLAEARSAAEAAPSIGSTIQWHLGMAA